MEARRLPAYLPKTAKNNLYLEILEAQKGWLTVKSNPEISEALKRGKEVVDVEVENALLNLAKSGNITAIIFWLKNRKPNVWRDKQKDVEDEHLEDVSDAESEVFADG